MESRLENCKYTNFETNELAYGVLKPKSVDNMLNSLVRLLLLCKPGPDVSILRETSAILNLRSAGDGLLGAELSYPAEDISRLDVGGV